MLHLLLRSEKLTVFCLWQSHPDDVSQPTLPLIHPSCVEGILSKDDSWFLNPLIATVGPSTSQPIDTHFCVLTVSQLTLQLSDNMAIQCNLSLNREVMPKMPFYYCSPLVVKKAQQNLRLLTKIHTDFGPRSIRTTKVVKTVATNGIIKTHFVVSNTRGSASRMPIATQLPHWIIVNDQGQVRVRRCLQDDDHGSTRLQLTVQQLKNKDKHAQRINRWKKSYLH